jgi:hypothetical protein
MLSLRQLIVGSAAGVLFLAPGIVARGHGTPIHVDVVADALVASGGLFDGDGFASMIFFEDDDEGDSTSASLPGLGAVAVWQPPGLDIFGMDDSSSLSIEVISRPVLGADPPENRVVWYWDPVSETIEEAAASTTMYLLGTGMRSETLSPPEGPAPPPFLLANSMAGQTGFHNHNLLRYALDNNPAAAPGVYGFLARLLSNEYEPSDPFLLAFNFGVDYEQMTPAVLAINAAAVDAAGLAGDFNNDGVVDAVDYTVWRNNLGDLTEDDIHHNGDGNNGVDPADYGWWKQHYGDVSPGGGGLAAAIPEPNGGVLALMAFAAGVLLTGRRLAGIVPRHLAQNSSVPFAASRRIMRLPCRVAVCEVDHAQSNYLEVPACAVRVHARRDLGRDRNHRPARGANAASHSAGARIGAQNAVRE